MEHLRHLRLRFFWYNPTGDLFSCPSPKPLLSWQVFQPVLQSLFRPDWEVFIKKKKKSTLTLHFSESLSLLISWQYEILAYRNLFIISLKDYLLSTGTVLEIVINDHV